MASTGKCPYCGGVVSSAEQNCPGCGAPNENFVAETSRTILQPKTIEELKEYCAQHGMPLLRMRFFIGEDFREPRAFGIYRDGDQVVVYKNKSDGSRAIRYRGRDEERGVNELFQKLLEECHNRGIYPDGKGPERSASQNSRKKRMLRRILLMVAIYALILIIALAISGIRHRHDGYYSTGAGQVYYNYGGDWYYTYDVNDAGYWYAADSFPEEDYGDYYLGDDFDSDWGVSDFKESSAWDSLQDSSSSSSSDYDSWDSGDTDWDSDW